MPYLALTEKPKTTTSFGLVAS